MIERNETERLAWNWFISVWRPRPRHRASASEFKVKMKVIKIKHVLAASLVSILNHCAGDLRTWGPLQQSDYSLPAVKNDSCAILFRIVRNIREIVYLHVAFNLLIDCSANNCFFVSGQGSGQMRLCTQEWEIAAKGVPINEPPWSSTLEITNLIQNAPEVGNCSQR